MAILGSEGFLRLRREAPDPIVVTPRAISRNANGFNVPDTDFWTGDQVYLYGPNGIPISLDAVPNGTGMYAGGEWDLGSNRIHVEDNDDLFWLQGNETAPGPGDDPADTELVYGDAAWFYTHGDPVVSGRFYVYIDQMGRITLYTDRRAAFYGDRSNRVPLYLLDFGFLTIAAAGTQDYDNAIVECTDRMLRYPADIVDSATLESICNYAPFYDRPLAGTSEYNDADVLPRSRIGTLFPWEFLCEMRAWTLETTAAAVDTTGVGDKFGESVKSVVTGGGTVDFMVDRTYESDDSTDTTALMRLALMTQKGSQVSAQFFLSVNNPAGACMERLPGDLYYEADLLVTNTAVNIRLEDVIAGTCIFVTTGEIALRAGPNAGGSVGVPPQLPPPKPPPSQVKGSIITDTGAYLVTDVGSRIGWS